MKEPDLDISESPRPWSTLEIGRNRIGQPVMIVRDANGHSVAGYVSYGDAHLIVASVNIAHIAALKRAKGE